MRSKYLQGIACAALTFLSTLPPALAQQTTAGQSDAAAAQAQKLQYDLLNAEYEKSHSKSGSPAPVAPVASPKRSVAAQPAAATVPQSAPPAQVSPAAQSYPASQTSQDYSPSQTNPTAAATPQAVQNDTTGTPGLPQAPQPKLTEPLFLRSTSVDYTHGHKFFPNPIADYFPESYPAPRLSNTPPARRSVAQRQDLPQSLGRRHARSREQLRHRHRAHQP